MVRIGDRRSLECYTIPALPAEAHSASPFYIMSPKSAKYREWLKEHDSGPATESPPAGLLRANSDEAKAEIVPWFNGWHGWMDT